MKDVKIVFFGTHNFSKGILESLIINQYNVIGVVSQPDKPVGRKHEIKPTPVKELALKHLYIKIDILNCAELILVQAHRIGNSIALNFRDTNSGNVYEINFYGVLCNSLGNFIERNTTKVIETLKGVLKVDIVEISF